MTIKSVIVNRPREYKTEKPGGLRYAVAYEKERGELVVIALFDSNIWAQRFIDSTTIKKYLSIIEIDGVNV